MQFLDLISDLLKENKDFPLINISSYMFVKSHQKLYIKLCTVLSVISEFKYCNQRGKYT